MTACPTPGDAADATALIASLRRLKAWSGRSYRELERRAYAAGDTLPASTAATMLGRDRLPREEPLVAFVRACGIDDVRPWKDARTAIAVGPQPSPSEPAPAASVPAASVPAAARTRLSAWLGRRWRPVVAAVLVAGAAVLGVPALGPHDVVVEEQVVAGR